MTNYYRNVYCVMGLPIDAVTMQDAVLLLEHARTSRTKCFLSTPNLNFTVASQTQPRFRESVCASDLSLADGMPLVWVAKLLGIPIRERVSGSDLFESLRNQKQSLWRVFFFGGPKGVGQTASLAIGDQTSGVLPTGYIYPGFVSNDEMSRDDLIEVINASQSDMVVVSLGAAKGQDWICRNRSLIDAPVLVHLGAVINFVAGSVKRAPTWMQKAGLEWIWRAKEESVLIKRYLNDGVQFAKTLATCVLPLMLQKRTSKSPQDELSSTSIEHLFQDGIHHVVLKGSWYQENIDPIRKLFTTIESVSGSAHLDMTDVKSIDSAAIALLLLLDQSLSDRGYKLELVNVHQKIIRNLKLFGVTHFSYR